MADGRWPAKTRGLVRCEQGHRINFEAPGRIFSDVRARPDGFDHPLLPQEQATDFDARIIGREARNLVQENP